MNNMEDTINPSMDRNLAFVPPQSGLGRIKKILVVISFFLFPLLFLPITQDFFTTTKLYIITCIALSLTTISLVEYLYTQRIAWGKNSQDMGVLLFFLSTGISILISSPNKIQAILNPFFGLLMVGALSVLYFYISRLFSDRKKLITIASYGALILAALCLVWQLEPWKYLAFIPFPVFMKDRLFTPIGNQFYLSVYVGYFALISFFDFLHNQQHKKILRIISLIILIGALIISISSQFNPKNAQGNILPPATTSWYAAVETLKSAKTAFFGVGVDNFSSMFTKAKDLRYNQLPVWLISSFSVSRSAILHIVTESGLLGLTAFILMLIPSIKRFAKEKKSGQPLFLDGQFLSFVYIIVLLLLFPPSLVLFFLLYITIALFSIKKQNDVPPHLLTTSAQFDNVFVIVAIGAAFILVGASYYALSRTYLAEYYYQQALNAYIKNDAKKLYDYQKQVITLNPYIERFRINFSQTNLLIANSVSAKTQDGKTELTETDKQIITQAIQTAISEGKAVVALNPEKSSGWENLAVIYRSILGVAQGADTWLIASYERAIILDPLNPLLRLQLGAVYYSLGKYTEAAQIFEQAVGLKSNWANIHYNLAWSYYYQGNYQRAAQAMQNVVSLIDPTTNKSDFEKATNELEEMKKKIPTDQTENNENDTQMSQEQLVLPTPIDQTTPPPIELPKDASPEAR